MKWRVYYADGSTEDGVGQPGDICRFQVQVIVQEDKDHGRQLVHFADYYLWRSDLGRWIGVEGDLSAMMALTQHTKEITCLLWGSMMAPEDWAVIQQRAKTDPGLPAWTAERKHDAIRR